MTMDLLDMLTRREQLMEDTMLDHGERFCLYFQGMNGMLQVDTTQNPWLFTFFHQDGTIIQQIEYLIDP